MKLLDGSPGQAATQILFKLSVLEGNYLEASHAHHDNTFGTLVLKHDSGSSVEIHEIEEKKARAGEIDAQKFGTARDRGLPSQPANNWNAYILS